MSQSLFQKYTNKIVFQISILSNCTKTTSQTKNAWCITFPVTFLSLTRASMSHTRVLRSSLRAITKPVEITS